MKKYLLSLILILIDIAVLMALFYLAYYLRVNIGDLFLPTFHELRLQNFYFVIFVIFILMFYENIYTLRYDFWQETKKIMQSILYGYLVIMALLALAKISDGYSRIFITIYFTLALLIIPLAKRYTKKFLYRFTFFQKRVYIIGEQTQKDILKKEFHENWYLGMRYDEKRYDTVIITSKGSDTSKMKQKIAKYLLHHAEVYIVPYISSVNFANSNIIEYSNIRYNTIQVENKLLLAHNIWIKNIAEFFIILIILLPFLVVHTVIGLLIRLDSRGAIFFKQPRLGKNSSNFICYKYRTMYENSEATLEKYLKEHPEEVVYYGEYHKYQNDPRITGLGKMLRATSLDELPQIINILKGEMSLIGPRPYMINESDKLGENKQFILKVKPGITGLWQVSGRNNLTFKERNELEIWYIKNWSLWADFVIIMKTIKVVLSKVGAK
ncbi:exopolysaccharide biosynthesis polyprenyl glycosylphosphotransferase [Sulfurimonas sp.]|uniref:exopolysaccharide biosynthesis polyprenyl glycosylphosphotransferase n=1 Tax=Sulfurimonas sp. TaxID=2022749 RepID=UPI0025D10809|nr:exopolysaccharide biosynthesis polyprenyl glycosylphosphotransferase [Sulfurimonas sp.]MDD5157861.1 exopolysaccharide biosynthesis polyprenyl glycosylphosphotransferase [Sulfurimonas sp.]